MIRVIIYLKDNKLEEHDFSTFMAAVYFLQYRKEFDDVDKIYLIAL